MPEETPLIHQHTRSPGSRFTDVDLSGSSFDDVNLRGARFDNVSLADASFRNVSLQCASVADAGLQGMTINGILVSELLLAYEASQVPVERAAAVLYAKDLHGLATFYATVLGLSASRMAPDHVVLESAALQLSIVKIPDRMAAQIRITTPPQRREDTPIKLVFTVPSLAEARAAAPALGGKFNPPVLEWTFQSYRLCDGHDPEGNVLQLRERLA